MWLCSRNNDFDLKHVVFLSNLLSIIYFYFLKIFLKIIQRFFLSLILSLSLSLLCLSRPPLSLNLSIPHSVSVCVCMSVCLWVCLSFCLPVDQTLDQPFSWDGQLSLLSAPSLSINSVFRFMIEKCLMTVLLHAFCIYGKLYLTSKSIWVMSSQKNSS